MNNYNKQGEDKDPYNRLSNLLLLNLESIDNNGLLNGRMGVAIYFFQLAYYTKNKIFEEIANEQLDIIINDINDAYPKTFNSGLCGIGWGIEYLINNAFVKATDNNIFEEIDNSIFSKNLNLGSEPEYYNDFYGKGMYYLCRYKNEKWNNKNLKLILENVRALLIKSTDRISSDYIISLLYFIYEIRYKQCYASEVNEIIAPLQKFIKKNIESNFNIVECHYIDIITRNLGINCRNSLSKIKGQSCLNENAELYIQSVIYESMFPKIQSFLRSKTKNRVYNNEILIYECFLKLLDQMVETNNYFKLPGLAFYASLLLRKKEITTLSTKRISIEIDESVYIIGRKSRASDYGIGTYMKELISGLKNESIDFTIIELESSKAEFSTETDAGINVWYIPYKKNMGGSSFDSDEYCRSILKLFQININGRKKSL